MEKRDRIIELLTEVRYTANDIEKVADEICLLFNVTGQSEQLCDCFIGFLSGEEVRKSDIKRQVDDIVGLQPQLKEYGMMKGEPQTAKQILDGRKGYLSRFSYCPYCGDKIKWKLIVDSCC